jgi:hypothetical protein
MAKEHMALHLSVGGKCRYERDPESYNAITGDKDCWNIIDTNPANLINKPYESIVEGDNGTKYLVKLEVKEA